jgi:hypothetical protein
MTAILSPQISNSTQIRPMSRYTTFVLLTSVLAEFMVFPILMAANAPSGDAKKIIDAGSVRANLTFTTPMGDGASSATKPHQRSLQAAGE